MIIIIAWSRYLHRAAHEVHVDALASGYIPWGECVYLGACATFILGDEAEAIVVFGCCLFISARAGVILGEVLEA